MSRRMIAGLIWLIITPLALEYVVRQQIAPVPDWRAEKPWPAEFYAEIQRAQSMIVDPDGLVFPGDFEGVYYNVKDGIRHTVGQPTHDAPTLYLFGNSTVFNGYLPDAYTLPSALQVLVPNFRIVNMGANGASARIQLARLEKTRLRSGDVVVFYDGPSDIELLYIKVYRAMQTHPCKSVLDTFSYLALSRAVCGWIRFPHVAGSDIDRMLDAYRIFIRQAQTYTASRCAVFLHIYQPHLYTISLSGDELLMDLSNPIQGLPDLYTQVWPRITSSMNEPYHIDLSHVLDTQRLAGAALYADRVHLTAAGNREIAAAMLPIVERAVRDRCTAIL